MKATKNLKVTGNAVRRSLKNVELSPRNEDVRHITLTGSPKPFQLRRDLQDYLGPHYNYVINQRGLISKDEKDHMRIDHRDMKVEPVELPKSENRLDAVRISR